LAHLAERAIEFRDRQFDALAHGGPDFVNGEVVAERRVQRRIHGRHLVLLVVRAADAEDVGQRLVGLAVNDFQPRVAPVLHLADRERPQVLDAAVELFDAGLERVLVEAGDRSLVRLPG
jgi:hypothetical protein